MESDDDVEPDVQAGHALLPLEKPAESQGEAEDQSTQRQPKLWRPSLRTGAFLGLLLLFTILTFAVAISNGAAEYLHPAPTAPATTSTPAGSYVKVQEDYILDPDWHFDDPPTTRVYHWTIADVLHNPDGVYRPMILINNQFPGPLIQCNEGDTVEVHVHNRARNSTSLHWHGIYQNGTNWMDGSVGINQCPIPPGADFTYNFTIKAQSGTYWYHAHHSVQAADGLFGPLIVHAREERDLQPVKYSTDRVIMVQDHYYNLTSELLMQYLQPDQENAEPVPDAALINGKGIRDCDGIPHRQCDNSTSALESLSLAPNQNHRLRFINVGAFAEFQIQVDEHDFAITEVDGTDVQSNTRYHRLNILPAQRYSMIVSANSTSGAQSFWLRARMITACFAEDNAHMNPEVRAVVRYASAPPSSSLVAVPTSRDWPDVVEMECRDMNTTELHPVVVIPAPESAGNVVNLRSNFEIGDWRLSRGFFNQSSWRPQVRSPILHRIMEGLEEGNASFVPSSDPPGINSRAFHSARELVFQSSGIQVVDILVSNFDDGAHPLHLHGHKFFVLASGSGYAPANITQRGVLDLSNPLRRDTATVDAYGWILVRFVADNAGVWAFHCHLAWHAVAGMSMAFWTRAEEMAQWRVPQENQRLCQLPGLESGMAPADSTWYGNS